ncbi:hypothetical protein T484DRAFT_1919329, partial [Baffinella frigidus]
MAAGGGLARMHAVMEIPVFREEEATSSDSYSSNFEDEEDGSIDDGAFPADAPVPRIQKLTCFTHGGFFENSATLPVETQHVELGHDLAHHVCPVCRDILLNPQTACLAGHPACRECHAKMVNPNKCFMCKELVDSTRMIYMRNHADIIDALPVCCDPHACDTNPRPVKKRSAAAMSGGKGAAAAKSGGNGAAAAKSGGKGAAAAKSGGNGAAAGEGMAGSGDNGEGMEEEMGETAPVFGAVATKGGSGVGKSSFRLGSVVRGGGPGFARASTSAPFLLKGGSGAVPEAVSTGGGSSPRCSWTGLFGKIHEHWQNDCEYTFAHCQARGCHEKVLLKDRDAHVELCKTKVIVCTGCNIQFQRHEFEDHELKCQLLLLGCVHMPECKVHCIRGYMDHHLKHECHYAKIPCPFPGCHKPIVRRDMPTHLKRCHISGRRMHNAFKAFEEMEEKLATAESEARFAAGLGSNADDPDIARVINMRISGWGCGFAESEPIDYGNRVVQARWMNSNAEARLGAGQELAADQHGVFFGIRIRASALFKEDDLVQFTVLLQLLDKYDGVAKVIFQDGSDTNPLSYDFKNSSDGLFFGDHFSAPALVAESCKREDGSFRVRAMVWIAPDARPPKTGDGADAVSRSGAAGAGNGAGAAGAGNGAGAAGAGNGARAMSQSSEDCVEVSP